MKDFKSQMVYIRQSDAPQIEKLVQELPYLQTAYGFGYPEGEIDGEKIIPVILWLDMIEGD